MPTVEEIFQKLDELMRQDPSQVQGKNAIFQFDISGRDAGTYQIILREDGAYARPGSQESPDLTIIIDSENFKKLVEGKMNPAMAFMMRKMKVQGNMGLAPRLKDVLDLYQSANS